MKIGFIILTVAVLFVACSDSKYENAKEVSELSISFNDPQWDGKLVPKIGQCKNCGGGGLTGCPRTSKNPIIPFPLTEEGLGGGGKMAVVSRSYLIPLPLIPSRQGRGN